MPGHRKLVVVGGVNFNKKLNFFKFVSFKFFRLVNEIDSRDGNEYNR